MATVTTKKNTNFTLESPQLFTHDQNGLLFEDRLMPRGLPTKVTEKTLITSIPCQKVDQILCLIRESYPNIKTEVLIEILMALLSTTVIENDKENS